MKNYIIYNVSGKILRTGTCSNADFEKQVGMGEFVMEGKANDSTQKIVGNEVVNKTPEEVETDKPPEPEPVPFKQQPASITNANWQDILSRLADLESKQ